MNLTLFQISFCFEGGLDSAEARRRMHLGTDEFSHTFAGFHLMDSLLRRGVDYKLERMVEVGMALLPAVFAESPSEAFS